MSRFFCVEKPPNIKVHSATSYLIFQYLQYWYYQYFPESSSICNTGITSIFQNLPVSTILIFRQCLVSSSIADTGQFWKILGYQYLPVSVPVLQILEDTGKILVIPVLCTSIVVPVSRPASSYYPKNHKSITMVLHVCMKEKKTKKQEKNHKSITMVLHVCMKEKKTKQNNTVFFI